MKKIIIGLLTSFLLVAMASPPVATAQDRGTYELGGSLAYGTGPAEFDSEFGLSFGGGYMLKDIDPNLQGRIDLSFFSFDRTVAGADLEYSRIPIAVGGRYYFPLTGFNLFAEAAVEVSFDEIETSFAGTTSADSEVNLGLTPGAGIDFFVGQNVSVFALGRYHVISDDYFSAHLGAAYHF